MSDRRLATNKVMTWTCLMLAALSLGCLVFAIKANEHAAQAEKGAATNRYLNCLMLAKLDVRTPHCEDFDILK